MNTAHADRLNPGKQASPGGRAPRSGPVETAVRAYRAQEREEEATSVSEPNRRPRWPPRWYTVVVDAWPEDGERETFTVHEQGRTPRQAQERVWQSFRDAVVRAFPGGFGCIGFQPHAKTGLQRGEAVIHPPQPARATFGAAAATNPAAEAPSSPQQQSSREKGGETEKRPPTR